MNSISTPLYMSISILISISSDRLVTDGAIAACMWAGAAAGGAASVYIHII